MIERIAGQLATEAPVILLEQRPQNRAAQRSARSLLKLNLLAGRRGLSLLGSPRVECAPHEILLDTPVAQKSIDLFEAFLQDQVIDIPDDGRQLRSKFLREWDDVANRVDSL